MNIQEKFFKISIIPIVSLIFSITGCFLTDDKLFKASLKYCRVFSSGVFFSILFFDLIPDLVNDISYKETKKNPNSLILPFMTILISYVVMLIIGKSIEGEGGCPHHNHVQNNELNNSENNENLNKTKEDNKKKQKKTEKRKKEKNPKKHEKSKNNKKIKKASDLKIITHTHPTTSKNQNKDINIEAPQKKNSSQKVFYTFLIHDFFTGIFIALSLNSKSFESTLAALILHKLIEGLSLGMKFGSEEKKKSVSIFKLCVLSFMIFFGTLVGLLGTEFFKKLTLVSESVIIGSFLYICIDENSVKLFTKVKNGRVKSGLLAFYFTGIISAFLIFNHEAFF